MVEFALVLPVLMMFVFGIVEFGRGYNARIELTAAVREGARTAALGGTAAETEARTRAAAGAGLAAAMRFTPPTPPMILCAGVTPPPQDAKVTVEYTFTYDIPFVGRRTRDLTATGVMRCGG